VPETSVDELSRLAAALADRYVLEEEIGRGASATVFLAEDRKHGRRIALKVLHPSLGAALGVERFQREIATVARLHHPHVLPLFDSGSAAGRLYYTMPYVETGSLRDRLRRAGQLPLDAVAQLTTEISSALAYAHALGVIHRDIKPENIMISVTDHALLTDFGIAHVLDGAGSGTLTDTGLAVGTPAYMSPEQSSGDEPIDGRSDIYALASVAYESLTGTQPFTGPTGRAIIAKRLLEPAPSVREIRPDIPPAAAAVLQKAMARQPDDRFETAAEFAGALDAAVREPAVPRPWWPQAKAVRGWAAAFLAVMVVAVGLLLSRRVLTRTAAPDSRRMVAVLPFKNLGQPADQYFADGLTEEITTRLAGLSGLGVISRTSADQYRSTTKSLKQIGEELGVGYVLEGSVRWERSATGPGQVRVTPQLIQVRDDSHLWAEKYDAELTEVFRIQSNIAEQVTLALDVALRPPERAALAAPVTRSAEAYDLYLRGNEYASRSWQREEVSNALQFYERAVTLDPSFAAAQARLARTHLRMYWHFYDRSNRRLQLAKKAADAAVALAPDLPESHIALGYYYYHGLLDYDRALKEFELARRSQPSNSDLLSAIGYVERRRGRWQESLARFIEALRYDPRSSFRLFDVGDDYFSLRKFPEAEHYLDRAIALSPDWVNPYVYKAWLYVVWRGDLRAARAVLRQALSRVEVSRVAQAIGAGDRVSTSILSADSTFASLLDGVSLATFRSDEARYHVLKADAAQFRGQTAVRRAHGDSARVAIETSIRSRPEDAKLHAILGLAYAHAGRNADAVRAAERAVALLPISRDAVSGPYLQSDLARVYVTAGKPDKAIAVLERLLKVSSSWVSPAELRVDPVWDPLRSHPRFQELVASRPTTR
jgi:TolB-like protein/Flp pilus assembly protein TadD/tRNA A-37 threonylcarbamoyl transferase component Bud32